MSIANNKYSLDPVDVMIIKIFESGKKLTTSECLAILKKDFATTLKEFGIDKISPSFVSKRVNKLVKRGLLDRYPRGGHGKRVVYFKKTVTKLTDLNT